MTGAARSDTNGAGNYSHGMDFELPDAKDQRRHEGRQCDVLFEGNEEIEKSSHTCLNLDFV